MPGIFGDDGQAVLRGRRDLLVVANQVIRTPSFPTKEEGIGLGLAVCYSIMVRFRPLYKKLSSYVKSNVSGDVSLVEYIDN